MARNKKAEKLGKKVLTLFTQRITDEIFLFMQRNPELLKEYQEAVKSSSAHGVNAVIGKMITEAYDLENLNKETNPDCPLLKKYTRHGVRWKEDKKTRMHKDVMYGGSSLFNNHKKRTDTSEVREKDLAELQQDSLFGDEPEKK